MTVEQVIALAKSGELKNVAAAKGTETMIGYINRGLIELYKVFPIATEEVIITIGSDGTAEYPYTMINDTIYKLPSNFMYLIAAYDEVPEKSGELVAEIPINEEDNPLSINMVGWNKVQIPLTVTGANISLVYGASPEFISSDALDTEIPIPIQLLDPLLIYLGYIGHTAVGSTVQEEDAVLLNRFEVACEKVKALGLFTGDDVAMGGRLSTRGFV